MPLVGALACLTATVPQVDRAARDLVDALGYQPRAGGTVSPPVAAAWGLPALAGSPFALLAAPGAARGAIRLVEGRPRPPSERLTDRGADAAPLIARWAGAELVVRDVDRLAARLAAAPGFRVTRGPVTFDLAAQGSNRHRSLVALGPGGLQLMLTMALTEPAGRSFPRADGEVGPVFAAHLRTAEPAAALALYRDALGMEPFLRLAWTDGPWHGFWSLPPGTPVEVHVLKGDAPGTGLGSVELQAYPAELLDPAPPPVAGLDGGAAMVTYTAADVVAARAASARFGTAVTRPVLVDAPPYAGARAFTLRGPAGEHLEISEPWPALNG